MYVDHQRSTAKFVETKKIMLYRKLKGCQALPNLKNTKAFLIAQHQQQHPK